LLKREERRRRRRRRRRDNNKAPKKICKGGQKNLQLQSKTQLFPKEFTHKSPQIVKIPLPQQQQKYHHKTKLSKNPS
jgi:hypothetical protein